MEIRQLLKAQSWAISQHSETNHLYDKYLPYAFHLNMVAAVCREFRHLESVDPDWWNMLEAACYGHDLIEDCRVTYNDCIEFMGRSATEIIYAVTNEKGRNRSERANDKYYEGIRKTPGAVFVKLCDRIANVRYSKMVQGSMLEKYKKENDHFINQLAPANYSPMVDHLFDLLK